MKSEKQRQKEFKKGAEELLKRLEKKQTRDSLTMEIIEKMYEFRYSDYLNGYGILHRRKDKSFIEIIISRKPLRNSTNAIQFISDKKNVTRQSHSGVNIFDFPIDYRKIFKVVSDNW